MLINRGHLCAIGLTIAMGLDASARVPFIHQGSVAFWHGTSGDAVALSADNSRVAVGGERIVVFAAESGAKMGQTLDTHGVSALAFSSDRTLILSGHSDGWIRLWGGRKWAKRGEWRASKVAIERVAFAGKRLVSGDAEGVIRVHSAEAGAPLKILFAGTGRQQVLELRADAERVAAAFGSCQPGGACGGDWVGSWPVGGGASREMCVPESAVLAFDPQGTLLARVTYEPGDPDADWVQAGHFDLHLGPDRAAPMRVHGREHSLSGSDYYFNVASSQSGHRVVILAWTEDSEGTYDQTLAAFDATGRPLWRHELSDLPMGLTMSPDGSVAVATTQSGRVRRWNAVSGEEAAVPALPVDIAGAGTVAAILMPKEVLLFSKGKPAGRIKVLASAVRISANARRLATIGAKTKIWDVKRRRIRATLPDQDVSDVALSPDGKWIAVGTSAMVEDGAHGELIIRRGRSEVWRLDEFYVTGVAWSPNGRWVAAMSVGNGLRLLDSKQAFEGRELPLPDAADNVCRQPVFTSDGKTLLCGGEEKLIERWDTRSGKRLDSLALGWPVGALAMTGSTLAVSHGRELKVYTYPEGKPLSTAVGHDGRITRLAFGSGLVSLGDEGIAQIQRYSVSK